ncbi:MAG: metallophosphoesterase [candidate division WOR-3 bacterium]
MQRKERNLILTDIHLGVTTFSQNYQKSFMESETKNLLEWVLTISEEYISKNSCFLNLIFLGDWFHYNNPRFDLIMWSIDYFQKASKIFNKIFFIPGNHDYRTDGYSTDFLKKISLSNLYYYDMLSDNYVEIIDDTPVLFVPFFDAEKFEISYSDFVRKQFENVGSTTKTPKKGILFGHFYDKYAKVGSETNIITKKTGDVALEDFSDLFFAAVSGHVHTHQIYKSKDIEIIYPGSLQSFTAHDIGKEKKLMLFEIKDNNIDIEWIYSPATVFIKREFNPVDTFEDLDNTKEYVIYLLFPKNTDIKELVSICYNWKQKHPNIKYIHLGYGNGNNSSNYQNTYVSDEDFVNSIPHFPEILLNNSCSQPDLKSYVEYLIKVCESQPNLVHS